jgi:hypothetical protein
MAIVFHHPMSKAVFLRYCAVVAGLTAMFLSFGPGLYSVAEEAPLPDSPGAVQERQSALPAATTEAEKKTPLKGQQSKRILGVIPNFRSVSVDDQFVPITPEQKFKLAARNSFDYTSFVASGMAAGISQWRDTYPEFGQGAAGYGRRYWHGFTDQTLANATTIFLLPVVTREDPRYFTMGHGTFRQRSRYAATRIFITRSDSGTNTANISEIGGRALYAGASVLYYPSHYQTASEAASRFGVIVGFDAFANLAKEFWPDIRYWITKEKK